MNQIELTEEHKTKLLEMCRTLFLEFSNHTFEENCQLGAYSYDFNNLIFSNETKNHIYKGLGIHWFEFSWILLNQILTKLKKTPLEITKEIELYGIICFNHSNIVNHPIDYLYDHFKKLK